MCVISLSRPSPLPELAAYAQRLWYGSRTDRIQSKYPWIKSSSLDILVDTKQYTIFCAKSISCVYNYRYGVNRVYMYVFLDLSTSQFRRAVDIVCTVPV